MKIRKGYILGVLAAIVAVVIYHNYSLGFLTLAQAIVWFFLFTFLAGCLIEALSKMKKFYKEAAR